MAPHLRRRASGRADIAHLATCLTLAVAACRSPAFPTGRDDLYGTFREDLSYDIDRADAIYRDPDFWRLVEERPWLPQPDGDRIASGKEVRASLEHLRPAAQAYYVRYFGANRYGALFPLLLLVPTKAIASTDACPAQRRAGQCGEITVNITKIERSPARIATIAHETTHTLGRGSATDLCRCTPNRAPDVDASLASAGGSLYTDTPIPGEEFLVWTVSYTLGDLAHCYAASDRDSAKTRVCMADIVNSSFSTEGHRRRKLECCHAQPPRTLSGDRLKEWTAAHDLLKELDACRRVQEPNACDAIKCDREASTDLTGVSCTLTGQGAR